MNSNERLTVQRVIASILDHPSVYMGGPSPRSLKLADSILVYLERSKRLNATACDHSGWTDYKQHGASCPVCNTIFPEKMGEEFIKVWRENEPKA